MVLLVWRLIRSMRVCWGWWEGYFVSVSIKWRLIITRVEEVTQVRKYSYSRSGDRCLMIWDSIYREVPHFSSFQLIYQIFSECKMKWKMEIVNRPLMHSKLIVKKLKKSKRIVQLFFQGQLRKLGLMYLSPKIKKIKWWTKTCYSPHFQETKALMNFMGDKHTTNGILHSLELSPQLLQKHSNQPRIVIDQGIHL